MHLNFALELQSIEQQWKIIYIFQLWIYWKATDEKYSLQLHVAFNMETHWFKMESKI